MLPQIPSSDSKYHYESDYQQKYQQYYANQPVYYQPIQGKLLDHTFNSSVRSELT